MGLSLETSSYRPYRHNSGSTTKTITTDYLIDGLKSSLAVIVTIRELSRFLSFSKYTQVENIWAYGSYILRISIKHVE